MESAALPKNFDNLVVYKKAKSLSIDVIRFIATSRYSRSYDFLTQQLFRSVTSIGANITEGYGKYSKKAFKQYLSIARGSSYEVRYWLEIITELQLFDKQAISDFAERNCELIRMMTSLMKRLEVEK